MAFTSRPLPSEPEVEEAHKTVKSDVDEMVAHGPQLVEVVVPAEGEHAERTVRLVRLILKRKLITYNTL